MTDITVRSYLHLTRTESWATWPNRITWLRLVATPIPVALMLNGYIVSATVLFAVLVATDWVDGWLAKRNNGRLMTQWGTITDPIVDKILVLSVSLAALAVDHAPIAVIALSSIMAREVAVAWAKRLTTRVGGIVSASEAGRFSMVAQSAAVTLWLLSLALLELREPAHYALIGAAGASLASGWAYVAAGLKVLATRRS